MSGHAGRLRELLRREPGIFSIAEEADLRALLDEREQDVRAVVEACAGVVDGSAPQPIRHECAIGRLRIRFAGRIAELDGHSAAADADDARTRG